MTFASESSSSCSYGSSVPQQWRVAFLTASTWASATASASELAFALANWTVGQTPEAAVAVLKHRRGLVQRGLLRVPGQGARREVSRDSATDNETD